MDMVNFIAFNAPSNASNKSISWDLLLDFTLFLTITPAPIATKPNLLPDLGPLFPPGKGSAALITSLFRQIDFFVNHQETGSRMS